MFNYLSHEKRTIWYSILKEEMRIGLSMDYHANYHEISQQKNKMALGEVCMKTVLGMCQTKIDLEY